MTKIPPKKMAETIVKTLKKQRPDYNYVKKVFEYIRKDLGFKGRPPKAKKLPEILTESELTQFYDAVANASDRTHTVMIKLLILTGIRNSELANLSLKDVDLAALKIRVEQGKGKKDRYVPFPGSFRGELIQFIENQKARGAKYLFETNRLDKFTTRWIRAITKRYAVKAGIQKRIYPHLFRHQLLTHLTKRGIVDSKLQLISGHKNRKNLELYQELSLVDVADEYQKAMKDFPIT